MDAGRPVSRLLKEDGDQNYEQVFLGQQEEEEEEEEEEVTMQLSSS